MRARRLPSAGLILTAGYLFLHPTALLSARTVSDALTEGDPVLGSGEYRDVYEFEGTVGQSVVIDLRSSAFDPYLIVRFPSGKQTDNDDWEGSPQHSRIELTLTESGTHRVEVTSYEKGETGAYRLELPGSETAARLHTVSGRLEKGDGTLNSGEFRDNFSFEGVRGQTVVIDLSSTEFDPYLLIKPPTGDTLFNDDWEGSPRQSRIELTLEETGRYTVTVTSFEPGETGTYELQLPGGDGAPPSEATATAATLPGVRRERGTLGANDDTLSSGEFRDIHRFSGKAGDRVVIDLRSSDFDPYVMVRGPDGFKQDNDDHEGSANWSQIAVELPATGDYTIIATTYKVGAAGSYDLVITQQGAEATGPREFRREGSLARGDTVLTGGEFADKYPLDVVPGTRVALDLSSSDFDTYLALRAPSGETVSNDDYEGSSNRSRIEHVAAEAGEYMVYVTSYQADETGAYRLTVATSTEAPSTEPARDLTVIAPGQSRRGELSADDLTLDEGEFSDVYAFEGTRGQTITVDLTSSSFDTYLILITPNGESVQNDDFEGSQHRSRIELPLEQDGRYRILATSYAANATGAYEVSLSRATPTAPTLPAVQRPLGNGQVYGVFVGVSDYGGRANNLAYTDADARRVYEALQQGAGMPRSQGTLLIDSEATRGNFEAAIRRIASRATADDTVVIFFSGHGGRYDRPTGFDRSDPDGKDESLEFFDTHLLDDEFNELLGTIHAGKEIIVVDACFSGGLAKDIISAPGRMGLFSSEEDVTSAVAAKFRAGGYLSVFFRDSLIEPAADADGNGELSALEMSHYISECYRAQVKSSNEATDWVNIGQNLGYQKLVVDRGSIRPHDTLFRTR